MPALGEASASDDPTEDVASASLSASPERTDSFLRASASAGPGDSNASLYFSTVSHVPRRGDCLADTAVSQDFSSVQRSREHGGESEMDAAAGADAPGTYTGLPSSPVVGSEAARSPRRSRGFQLPSEGDGADPSLAEENLSRAINSSLNLSQLDPLRLDDVLDEIQKMVSFVEEGLHLQRAVKRPGMVPPLWQSDSAAFTIEGSVAGKDRDRPRSQLDRLWRVLRLLVSVVPHADECPLVLEIYRHQPLASPDVVPCSNDLVAFDSGQDQPDSARDLKLDTPEKIEMMEKRISPFINNILGSASPLSRGSVSPVSKESVVKRVHGKASRGLAISAEGGASTVAKAAKVSAKRSPARPQIVRKGSGDEAESKFRDQKQTELAQDVQDEGALEQCRVTDDWGVGDCGSSPNSPLDDFIASGDSVDMQSKGSVRFTDESAATTQARVHAVAHSDGKTSLATNEDHTPSLDEALEMVMVVAAKKPTPPKPCLVTTPEGRKVRELVLDTPVDKSSLPAGPVADAQKAREQVEVTSLLDRRVLAHRETRASAAAAASLRVNVSNLSCDLSKLSDSGTSGQSQKPKKTTPKRAERARFVGQQMAVSSLAGFHRHAAEALTTPTDDSRIAKVRQGATVSSVCRPPRSAYGDDPPPPPPTVGASNARTPPPPVYESDLGHGRRLTDSGGLGSQCRRAKRAQLVKSVQKGPVGHPACSSWARKTKSYCVARSSADVDAAPGTETISADDEGSNAWWLRVAAARVRKQERLKTYVRERLRAVAKPSERLSDSCALVLLLCLSLSLFLSERGTRFQEYQVSRRKMPSC